MPEAAGKDTAMTKCKTFQTAVRVKKVELRGEAAITAQVKVVVTGTLIVDVEMTVAKVILTKNNN